MSAAPSLELAKRIVLVLRGKRLRLDNEKLLQQQMADVFAAECIAVMREHRLAPGEVIDFLVDRVGIEVKIKGQRRAIYRQCDRYCQHAAVDALILVTNAAMGMPSTLTGKPVFVVALGQGWLG